MFIIILSLVVFIIVFTFRTSIDNDYKCNWIVHLWAILVALANLMFPSVPLYATTFITLLSFHINCLILGE